MKAISKVLPVMMFLGIACVSTAADPAWWAARGVTTTAAPSNLSPATIGQAKHMASMALAELQTQLSQQDYQSLYDEVAAIVNLAVPQTPTEFENQRQVLLTGQLKALAKPIYDKLRLLDAAWLDSEMDFANTRVVEPGSNPIAHSPYPWTVVTSDDQNMAVATLGQLKAVFSLRLALVDSDHDGLADSWEMQYFSNLDQTPAGDPDGDGLTNSQEMALGFDPSVSDAEVDSDGDGLTNLDELARGTDTADPDTDGDQMGDGYEVWHQFAPLVVENGSKGPNGDFDSDGTTNANEALTGRMAKLYNDYFSLNPANQANGGMIAKWFGSKGFWYTIQYSTNLATWTTLPTGFLGNNAELSVDVAAWYAAPLPPALFVRLYIGPAATADMDGDGLGAELEFQLGLDPTKVDSDEDGINDGDEDSDGDGLTNLVELQIGTDPSDADSDGDGISDGSEWDQETDPKDPADRPVAEWFILTGNGAKDITETRSRTITIPPGESRIVQVAVASDEFPGFTSGELTDPEGIPFLYNDTLVWNVQPSSGQAFNGNIDVNSRHGNWELDEINQVSLQGFSPVHIESTGIYTAPENAPLTVQIQLSATNKHDGLLPSTVMVGLLPVEVTVAFGVGPTEMPDGSDQSSRELLEEYLDGIKVARQGDVWAVKGKDQQGNEKFWGVEIVTEQEKLKAALSASGRHVVFDGHSNFGFGPDFLGADQILRVSDFTNFGARHTDVPLTFRKLIRNPQNPNDPSNFGEPYGNLVIPDDEIAVAPTNYKPLPINELRFENIDGIGEGQVFPLQGQGFETWHYRLDAASKRLMITAPKMDLPATLGYKSFFYNACSSGIDYIENFKHGDLIYTNESCFVHQGTKVFVQGVIEGKTTAQIVNLLNQDGIGLPDGEGVYGSESF